jgi:hypothetical protein
MTATVHRDGSIEFSSGLLSIREITKTALRVFMDSQEKAAKVSEYWQTHDRVNKLRESCGAEPEKLTLRVRMPEKING